MALVVRVKRKRTDEASETICLMEGDNPKKARVSGLMNKFSQLQAIDQGQTRAGRVILRRVNVVSEPESAMLGELPIVNYVSNCTSIRTESSKLQYRVTSKSRITTNSKDIVMIDMACMTQKTMSNTIASHGIQAVKSPEKRIGTKIFDPATRNMHSAFDNALGSNHFDGILQAIAQGADINAQRQPDGMSALIIAVIKLNVKVTSMLLARGARVFDCDSEGRNALDYAEYNEAEDRNPDSSQISILLRHASHIQYGMQMAHPPVHATQHEEESKSVAEEYVYDVYTITDSELQQGEHVSEVGEEGVSTPPPSIPTIKVNGLKIVSGEGSLETVFYYDSDWSDLADDEDPDSNDENFFGNDYPDEEEEEENNALYLDKGDEDDDDSEEEQGGGGKRAVHWGDQQGASHAGDELEEEEGGDSMPKFDRKSVGRVLRPFVVHQDGESGEAVDVEKLWSLAPDPDPTSSIAYNGGGGDIYDPMGGEDEDTAAHEQRREDMAQRTGMTLASSRDFHSNGLPKYGAELSDDEPVADNWTTVGSCAMSLEQRKEEYNYEAYDSDLDRDST